MTSEPLGDSESGVVTRVTFHYVIPSDVPPSVPLVVIGSTSQGGEVVKRFRYIVLPNDRTALTAMQTLDHTRVTIAAQAVGIAQGALDHALAYAKERRQFGKAIADFQGLQFLLADMGMKVEAARQLTYAAAGRSERNDSDLTFFGAAAKCFASDTAMQVTTDAVQVLGGYGFTRDFPVERMMRDAKITQIYEGTNQVQRIVMARQLLAGIQSEL